MSVIFIKAKDKDGNEFYFNVMGIGRFEKVNDGWSFCFPDIRGDVWEYTTKEDPISMQVRSSYRLADKMIPHGPSW